MLGISPAVPYYDLNLAGRQGVPPVEQVAHSPLPTTPINPPTFSTPDTHITTLAPYNLTEPGIDLRSPFEADPLVPDLMEYDHPIGLDMHPDPQTMDAYTQQVDPFLADLLAYQQPAGITVIRDFAAPDPLIPDLQHPDLTPEVRMSGRPGDLDPSALDVLHASATYQELEQKTYPGVFMDQSGMNDTRSRHMDLLLRGLDMEG
jgi:hypothetical protein